METRAPYVLVGVFVIVLLGALVATVLWIAQVQLGQQYTYYDIYFEGSVSGLTQGSSVRYNGIPVGRVAEIRLDPQDPTRVRVTVELEGGTVVKSDAVASLELQGLTGGAYVNLSGGTREAPPLERQAGQRYPVIASRPSGLQQVVTSAPEALARLIGLADQLSAMLSEENRKSLTATLDNLRVFTDGLAGHTGDLDAAITNGTAAMRDLRTTLDTANDILVALRGMIAPSGEAHATLQSVQQTAHDVSALARRLDGVVADNQPQLHQLTSSGFDQLNQLVIETRQLVVQLSRIADTIERDPSRFLYGDRREGYQPR